MAFLVVLEAMTPAERVAFILHDVFRYPFAEVAEIVGRGPEACRQLASSARRRIRATQPDAASRPDAVAAARRADVVRGLQTGMGGQGHRRPRRPAGPRRHGHRRRRRTRHRRAPPCRRRRAGRTLPRRPGRCGHGRRDAGGAYGQRSARAGGPTGRRTVSVMAFDVTGDRIHRIWAVLNPDKLRFWTTG